MIEHTVYRWSVSKNEGSHQDFSSSFFAVIKKSHTCPEGYEIPGSLICDGTNHCSDNSDENNCTPEDHLCPEGYSIPTKLKCDGIKQCSDGSDEFGCSNNLDTAGMFSIVQMNLAILNFLSYYVHSKNPSFIFSWSISHILEHEFFCLGCFGSYG